MFALRGVGYKLWRFNVFSVYPPLIPLPRTFGRLDTQLATDRQGSTMSSVASPRGSNQDGSIEPYLVISEQDDSIYWLEYLPDGQWIVTGSLRGGVVKVWNLESGKQEGALIEHSHINGLAVTRDGTKIITNDYEDDRDDEKLRMWDVASHKLIKEWSHPGGCFSIAISPDDQFIAGGGWNIAIWTMEGRLVNSIEVQVGDGDDTSISIWSMCFSPDGKKLACSTNDDIRVYDVNSGTLIAVLSLDGDRLFNVLWSRDGSKLFASPGGTIQCWNSDTGQQIGHPWTGHTGAICSLSLSPDGSILASASFDHTVHFWNATTGDPIGQHLQHDDGVRTVHFSPSKIYIWRVDCLGQCQTSNFKYVFPVLACSTMI